MKKALTAARLVLADLTKLEIPTIAAAVASVAAPVILALFGVDFAPGVILAWLTTIGFVAATLQRLVAARPTSRAATRARATAMQGSK